jgi:AcrR family transcriptional regulator
MPARRTPPLSAPEIVGTALALTAAHGLDALSMRTVAAELGVTPMALYHHVGDKDALVGLVADAVVAAVPTPAGDLPWDVWLAAYHDALWKQLHGFPGVARHLLEHPSTPAGAAIRRLTVDVLVAGGFDDRTALLAASTFHTHLLGRLAIQALPPEEHREDEPAWRAHGLTAEDYAAHGVATLIAGLRAQRQACGAWSLSDRPARR